MAFALREWALEKLQTRRMAPRIGTLLRRLGGALWRKRRKRKGFYDLSEERSFRLQREKKRPEDTWANWW